LQSYPGLQSGILAAPLGVDWVGKIEHQFKAQQ
jgi:hypothetical protein